MNVIPVLPEQCRNADWMTHSPDELTNLCDVHIDTTLPIPARMNAFVEQVGNPYLFRVDGITVRAVYPPDARRNFPDAVSALLAL